MLLPQTQGLAVGVAQREDPWRKRVERLSVMDLDGGRQGSRGCSPRRTEQGGMLLPPLVVSYVRGKLTSI